MKKHFVKRSLGTLRPAVRTKDRSPNVIGPIAIQRSDSTEIQRIFQETGCEEVICGLAGWFYTDAQGKCITVQLSPPYGRRPVVRTTIEDFLGENEDDEDDLPS